MDRKLLLDDPRRAIAERWGSLEACPHAAALLQLAEQIAALKPVIKQKQQDKQLCARSFGAAKAEGADIEPLRRRMQDISSALADLEQQRKALEQQLLELAEAATEPGPAQTRPPMPPRFAAPAERAVAGPCTIATIDAAAAADWDAYVGAHPNASLYHRYGWREVIARSFGHDTFYWATRDSGGAIRGVLPLVRLNSRLFGDFAVSMPFFNYGGPLADNAALAVQLLEHAADHARGLGLRHLEVRATHALNTWPARTDKVSMILQLPDSDDALEAALGAKLRSQVKRAQQEGAQLAVGGIDLLDDFYRVFAINMRDLGTPVYGRDFFRNILQAWPQQAHIIALRLRGKAVAAAFLLGDGDMLEIPWASTLRSANPLNMNMLLYREVLRFAIGQGYAYFDFGRSTVDAGTYRFKKQWGAQPVPHYWHYWLAHGGPLPELKPNSPKFKFLVKCWQRLPLPLSKVLGPVIVQYLP